MDDEEELDGLLEEFGPPEMNTTRRMMIGLSIGGGINEQAN